MKISVRYAVPDDVDWMVNVLRELAKEYPIHGYFFDEEQAPQRMLWGITTQVVLVAEDEKKDHLGFIAGTLTPHLFNHKMRLLSHQLWWVKPDKRMGKTSYKLLAGFLGVGKNKADVVFLNIRVGAAIKKKTLRKYGFVHLDNAFFLKVR